MGFLIALLMKTGLSEKLAKLASIGILIALAGLALWWLRHDAYNDGVHAMQQRIEVANNKYLKEKARADELAADRRLADTLAVGKQEKELLDAVAKAPDGVPDAARIALGCARLRQAGRDTTRIPACSGPPSGAQTHPR